MIAWDKINKKIIHPLAAHMLDLATCFQATVQLSSVRFPRVCGNRPSVL
ncbi:hypothetical protein MCEMAEM4_00585 [Burkholderiaceae bacterium]